MNNEDYQKDVFMLVLSLFGKIYGKTFLQKFFFILEEEGLPKLNLEYIPYHYGPFSRKLDELIKKLKAENLIKEEVTFTKNFNICRTFKLTPNGEKLINNDSKLVQQIAPFVNEFQGMLPSNILKYVYEKYPKMTINSVLI